MYFSLVSSQSELLNFATHHTKHKTSLSFSSFSGKHGTECLNTMPSLPTLIHAGYSVKLNTTTHFLIVSVRSLARCNALAASSRARSSSPPSWAHSCIFSCKRLSLASTASSMRITLALWRNY